MKKIPWSYLLSANILIIAGILALAIGGSKTVTTLSENAPLPERKCIIIDPGHGGVDGGATSCTGVLESKINLEISLRFRDLANLIGIKTAMIRTDDRSVFTEGESIAAKKVSDLKNRVKIANNTQNATLLSIHQNFFTDDRYWGAQVFYSKSEESKTFALELQKAFIDTLNSGSKRTAKQASGIYLMDNIQCPGVLVECGFLSNHHEADLLCSADYQKKLCCVLACVSSRYLYSDYA